MDKRQEREAVFWCSVLRPVLYGEIPRGGVAAFLRELAGQEITFPDGKRKRPSVSTLKRKLRIYRKQGFSAMRRKGRSDRGRARAVPAEVMQSAIEAKQEQPLRSDRAINALLEAQHGKRMARSTLYRHLKKAGATRVKLGVSKAPVRKRWTCEQTHDMWIGDLSDGPCVLLQGVATRTHVSAFIDVHSRYIVSARYYMCENLDVLCDTLIRALSRHGLPRSIYVDNAKIYHSHALKVLCWRHSIRLQHRPAGDPAPGGLIERFFQSVQGQFESEVRSGEILDLETLNRAFWAWLEVMYHGHVHTEINQTPKERFEAGLGMVRHVDLATIAECFLRRETRTVDRTFSDIKLYGHLYKVDPKLRGDRLEVRFDPFQDAQQIHLYALDGTYLGAGTRHHREEGQKPATAAPKQTGLKLLSVLEHKQRQLHAAEGVDYAQAATTRGWSFEAFAACLADLMGRKGGISAWPTAELARLQAIHARHPRLTRTQLKRACAVATHKTVPAIIHALQTLNQQEN